MVIFFGVILVLFLLLICSSRLYFLGIIYPWPLVIWVVTVLISVHYRLPLQRKILGMSGLDLLLTTSFTISLIPAAVHGLCALSLLEDWTGWDLFNFIWAVPILGGLFFLLGGLSFLLGCFLVISLITLLITALQYLFGKYLEILYLTNITSIL